MAKYTLECLNDYSVVLPASVLTDHNGKELCPVPEKVINHTKGQRITFVSTRSMGVFLRHPNHAGRWTIAT